jgi:lipid II:glycine glycyltransferase (peptidoglycan interpeptide bridge formation enzyme)
MRRLGTPSFPKRHFTAIMKHFNGMVDVREVLLHDNVVAASLNFHFRHSMHIYYAATDGRFNALAPNTFMYFDHLQWAIANGRSEFEFGRSKRNTGPFDFKTHWGTEMRPLPYNIILVRKKTVPNYTPTNDKLALAAKLWSRLPLPLTRAIGPRLIRMFP